ncbi:MAG TPA: hypothetical protein VFB99_10310, partial [Vicinamibacterales bacterium]|nr:hypothetical protein [Vicinamibacterales bacterium]
GVAPQAVAVAHGVSRQWAEAAAYTTLPKPATVEPLQIWRHRCHHAPAKTVLEVCDYRTYRGTVRAAKFGAHKFVPVKSLLTKERWAYEGIAAGPMKDKAPVVRPIAMHRELQRSGP